MNCIIYLFALVGFINEPADDTAVYITTYKDVAIAEMNRVGIPASIKLAQAILESNKGQSNLAKQSNNHFGIKCKEYWKGGTYFHKDDDRNEQGQLIKSCFRAYPRVMDSYVDHSNFLKSSPQYWWIFKIDKKDYKRWAEAIQMNGYATDPSYASKMVGIIEKYELNQYDKL